MNCPRCGSVVAQGTPFCPVCNEPLASAYQMPQQGYGVGYQGMPQQPTGGYPPINQGYQSEQQQGYPQQSYQPPYQPSYPPYEQATYPPGYQQPYVYGEQQRAQSALMSVLGELPHAFVNSFRAPAEALRAMLERNDTIAFPLVAGVSLLLCFLCGMSISRGFVETVFSLVSSLTGVSLASSASSMSQGVNYVAGRIAPSVGGVLVLCQLLAVLIPGLVVTVYLTVFCRQRFSWPAFLGMMTVPTYPTVVVTLAVMLASLVAPWLGLVCVLCGMCFNYIQWSALLSFLTGRSDAQLFSSKAVLFCVSLLLTLLSVVLVGGSLTNVIFQNILGLLSNVEALL